MRPERERGAALLTVLLLVAVIAVLAATALEKLRLSTRLAANAAALEQARGYAFAAETMAVTRVGGLLGQDASKVTLAGDWSDRPFPLPIPNGVATARVHDGGNCFNLNSLVSGPENGPYVANLQTMQQFARLIRLVRAPGAAPEAIAAAAADWIDSDADPLPNGAEDSAYAGYDPAYRTANTLMRDPSELRAVAGVTPEAYAALQPWLCTLPAAQRAVLNVNTLAPEQAPLIAMLLPDTLGVDAARGMLLKRPPQGWSNTQTFWNLASLSGSVAPGDAMGQTAVTTNWFALRIDVAIGGAELEEHGLIAAKPLPARLVARTWGEES